MENTEVYLYVCACVVCVFVVHTIAREGWETVCGALSWLPPTISSFLFFNFVTGFPWVAHSPRKEWLLPRLPSPP